MNSVVLTLLTLLISSVSSQFPNLNVIIGKGDKSEKLQLSSLETTLFNNSLYNPSLKNVIYFFGFTSSYEKDPTTKQVQQAFDTLGGYNFLVADWSSYNAGNYITVGNNLNAIAEVIGEKFASMVTSGEIKLCDWHFVGMSMGAHLAGSTARKIKSTSRKEKYLVPRITGLDPAGPLIYPANETLGYYTGLSANDGEMSEEFQIINSCLMEIILCIDQPLLSMSFTPIYILLEQATKLELSIFG